MSVLFATITRNTIVLCADKLTANAVTGTFESDSVRKIEKWSPTIAVGGTGSKALYDIIISSVHDHVKGIGFDKFSLEEIADLFGQCYYAIREAYTDMPKDALGKFIVAGKLSNGNVGAIQVKVANDEAEADVIESTEMPITLIFAPADMTDDECNQLFQKALHNTKNKKTHNRDLIEAVHRKAVRYVSEHSKFVGPKSDYIVLTPNNP